jgi:hypothetical protein
MHLQEPIVCLLVVCLWQCGSCAMVVSCDGTVLTCWLLYDLCGILNSCNMIVCWIYQSFVWTVGCIDLGSNLILFGPQIYIGFCCNNNGLENCGPLFTLGWAGTEMGLNLEISNLWPVVDIGLDGNYNGSEISGPKNCGPWWWRHHPPKHPCQHPHHQMLPRHRPHQLSMSAAMCFMMMWWFNMWRFKLSLILGFGLDWTRPKSNHDGLNRHRLS